MTRHKLSLRAQLTLLSLGAVVATATACLLIQRANLQRQGTQLTKEAMRGVLLSAENVRQSVSAMRNSGSFNPVLAEDVKKNADYRFTKLYQTVPVVSAWNAVQSVAAKQGYQFRVAALVPRNPTNQPRPEEMPILTRLENRREEDYFAVDEDRDDIVYARPIRLTGDCLACHGDPSTSPTGDGKDVVGFSMEGWKEGQIHGVFILHSSTAPLNAEVRAGMFMALAWVIPVAALVGFLIYYLLRGLSERLSHVSRELCVGSTALDEAAAQISKSSGELALGATEQAASLQQTSASSEEINSLTQQCGANSGHITELVTQSQSKYHAANEALDGMVGAMSEIQSQSGRISKIIKVIDEIAFQTNILALNAAVEAARAGDAGMGFAVVADEVRNLAQRCAQAARETTTLIEDSIGKSTSGKVKVDNLVEVIRSITEESARIKELVRELRASGERQEQGVGQIAGAVARMELVTQQTAAHAEENAASATELSAQAHGLKSLALLLRSITDGASADEDCTRAAGRLRQRPGSSRIQQAEGLQRDRR
ncbi:MAG: methyl-accepting chemotaxis protein [Paludibaculum sp.]